MYYSLMTASLVPRARRAQFVWPWCTDLRISSVIAAFWPTKQQSGDPCLTLKTMSSLRISRAYESTASLPNYGCHYMPSIIMINTLYAIDLCCIIVSLCYTMLAQYNGNIGSACFICVIRTGLRQGAYLSIL